MPEKLRTASKGLRFIGTGPELDELEVGMNRAAEQATPLAKQIFLGKTLDGLFFVLAQEERKIRKDPEARTTALLRMFSVRTSDFAVRALSRKRCLLRC